MQCPVCSTSQLVMSERAGVEIDYCPSCRGVWLDRGELDKIIERAAVQPAPVAVAPAPASPPRRDPDDQWYERSSGYGHKKKKSSWLSEIFD